MKILESLIGEQDYHLKFLVFAVYYSTSMHNFELKRRFHFQTKLDLHKHASIRISNLKYLLFSRMNM